jgi:hypothetical protein
MVQDDDDLFLSLLLTRRQCATEQDVALCALEWDNRMISTTQTICAVHS